MGSDYRACRAVCGMLCVCVVYLCRYVWCVVCASSSATQAPAQVVGSGSLGLGPL